MRPLLMSFAVLFIANPYTLSARTEERVNYRDQERVSVARSEDSEKNCRHEREAVSQRSDQSREERERYARVEEERERYADNEEERGRYAEREKVRAERTRRVESNEDRAEQRRSCRHYGERAYRANIERHEEAYRWQIRRAHQLHGV